MTLAPVLHRLKNTQNAQLIKFVPGRRGLRGMHAIQLQVKLLDNDQWSTYVRNLHIHLENIAVQVKNFIFTFSYLCVLEHDQETADRIELCGTPQWSEWEQGRNQKLYFSQPLTKIK